MTDESRPWERQVRHGRTGLAAAASIGSACANTGSSALAQRMKKPKLGAPVHVRRERPLCHRTLTPGWNRLKPGLRYAMLAEGRNRSCSSRGTSGSRSSGTRPGSRSENVRHSFAWIKGAAGRRRTMQVTKFTKAVIGDRGARRQRPDPRRRLHRHQHDSGVQGREDRMDRWHESHGGGTRGQEHRRAGSDADSRGDRRRTH